MPVDLESMWLERADGSFQEKFVLETTARENNVRLTDLPSDLHDGIGKAVVKLSRNYPDIAADQVMKNLSKGRFPIHDPGTAICQGKSIGVG